MSGGVLNAAMLLGLLGAAVPVVIHLLNRRREPVVDWGAMQFLDLGPRDRQKLRLTELLLMLARMALLALVALALARPFWSGAPAVGGGFAASAPPRDVVLVIDGSASMGRTLGGSTPHDLAVQWARALLTRLRPGDSVAVLVAGDRVRGLVDPPSFDRAKVDAALASLKPGRGASDLPTALAEAFRILERTGNPGRDVIVLTDGQRFAWRPGESGRWALVRDLQRRLPIPPRVWSIAFGAGAAPEVPNGSVGPLSVSRTLVTPGLPVVVSATLSNAGPGPLTRTAELLVDGRPVPGQAQAAGPVPAGGKTRLSFRTTLPTPGAHLLAVRLVGGDDALAADDESAIPIEVASALPVLLVDGEPGLEPLDGETDFLRAALAPTGDDAPLVRTQSVTLDALTPESLKGQRVAILANVERLAPEQAAAIDRFLDSGGGLLVAPGDRTNIDAFNTQPWIPAQLGALKGEPGSRTTLAHPAPRTFAGPVMGPFAPGETPALAEADLFAYRVLTPAPGASVSARLDTGDPWVVERSQGKARVILLAAPLDAEAGTLPVNPDFVPLVHEWVFHLAGGREPRTLHPGEPWVVDLDPPPAADLTALTLQTPAGTSVSLPVVRALDSVRVRFDDTNEAGVYRLTLPDPPGGFAYASVLADGRESDSTPLEPAEAATLAQGWPLVFEADPARLASRLLAAERGGRHEAWRGLILAALAGLCLEVYLTRRLVRSQGVGHDDA
ncbi:N-terminal double-transmembrane domain-containing protein [Singulisphaera sp. GP187]|uniref:VWA domain-containing protein n=1 Tax=Singulisphaera sp. GP187 TaxID=1882752 RepID=UPI0009276A87|nr:VWA domain-containing protein [Singulisphaera sp. GP187]SIO32286.1 N-terminal double-transmembrane domain-containing protein [Singulisphaera sp. GP187]